MNTMRWSRAGGLLVAAAGGVLVAGAAACGDSVLGLDSDGTEEVRIAMSVTQGAPEITYIVTNDFGVQQLIDGSLEIRIRAADTVTTSLPLDQKFQTGEDRRVFFQVIDTEQIETSVNVRVWLDETQVLQNAFDPTEEPLQVLYLFGGGVIVPEEITVV